MLYSALQIHLQYMPFELNKLTAMTISQDMTDSDFTTLCCKCHGQKQFKVILQVFTNE